MTVKTFVKLYLLSKTIGADLWSNKRHCNEAFLQRLHSTFFYWAFHEAPELEILSLSEKINDLPHVLETLSFLVCSVLRKKNVVHYTLSFCIYKHYILSLLYWKRTSSTREDASVHRCRGNWNILSHKQHLIVPTDIERAFFVSEAHCQRMIMEIESLN